MKPAHWLIALLAVAAVCWWGLGHPGYETREQRMARVEAQQQAAEAAKPKLYRWHDASGALQLTDTPPKGRKYEVVDMDKYEDDNVIPMSEAINPPAPGAKDETKSR
jgi:hypothetical protein